MIVYQVKKMSKKDIEQALQDFGIIVKESTELSKDGLINLLVPLLGRRVPGS